MWSHQQVSMLISKYGENPCLYMPQHNLYKNRNARNKALLEIKTELFKLGLDVTQLEIKNKWNNLRTNYLVQHRKYLTSLKSGIGTDEQELEKPTLWYYDEIQFIAEHSVPRKSEDSLLPVIDVVPSLECDYESEELNLEGRMSSTLNNDHLFTADEDHNTNPSKTIQIQNIHIKDPALECGPSSGATPVDCGTLSTSSSQKYGNNSRKRKSRKDKSEDADFMTTASNALANISAALTAEERPMQTPLPKSNIQTFIEFVGSQLEFLNHDEEILLETQGQITNIIWAARRKLCQSTNNKK